MDKTKYIILGATFIIVLMILNPLGGAFTFTIKKTSKPLNKTIDVDTYKSKHKCDEGKICGYVFAPDGKTPLVEAMVVLHHMLDEFIPPPFFTDENGYYETTDEYLEEGWHALTAHPPEIQSDLYLPLFKIVYTHEGETCWVNFTLENYRLNYAPENFKIEGPTRCKVGEKYQYTFSADDPENDQIYFLILWEKDIQVFYTADSEGKGHSF
jgi:hypothetical protein